MLDLTGFLLTNLVFLFISFVQSIVGFGFNVLGVPFLTALAGTQAAVAVISIPSTVNSVVLVARLRRNQEGVTSFKDSGLLPLLIMAAIGTALGAFLLKNLDPSIIEVALGLLVLLFVLTDQLRRNWQPSPAQARPLAIGIGIATGLLNGLAGICGPTLAPYLYTLRLDKNQFVYVINVLFIVLGAFQLVSFWAAGFYTWERVAFALGLIPMSLLGNYLGSRARNHVSQLFFNRLVLFILFVTALDLIRRGLHLF